MVLGGVLLAYLMTKLAIKNGHPKTCVTMRVGFVNHTWYLVETITKLMQHAILYGNLESASKKAT